MGAGGNEDDSARVGEVVTTTPQSTTNTQPPEGGKLDRKVGEKVGGDKPADILTQTTASESCLAHSDSEGEEEDSNGSEGGDRIGKDEEEEEPISTRELNFVDAIANNCRQIRNCGNYPFHTANSLLSMVIHCITMMAPTLMGGLKMISDSRRGGST